MTSHGVTQLLHHHHLVSPELPLNTFASRPPRTAHGEFPPGPQVVLHLLHHQILGVLSLAGDGRRVRVVIGPAHAERLVVVQGLLGHGNFGEFGVCSVAEGDEDAAVGRLDADLLQGAPTREMAGHPRGAVAGLQVGDPGHIERAAVPVETADAVHVIPFGLREEGRLENGR